MITWGSFLTGYLVIVSCFLSVSLAETHKQFRALDIVRFVTWKAYSGVWAGGWVSGKQREETHVAFEPVG